MNFEEGADLEVIFQEAMKKTNSEDWIDIFQSIDTFRKL